MPACILPFVQKWHSIDAARNIDIPILITHGAEDKLIPPSHSRVFAELPNVNRRLIEGAGHNNIGNFTDHRDAIEAFILGLEDQ